MYQLAKSVEGLKRSVMRDLMALAVRPDVISLAGGLPANECLPVESLKACVQTVLARDGFRALQYGPQYPPLREWIAGYMQKRGVACTANNVFITNGAQHALSILSRLLADPGDTVVTEELTFTGIHQVTTGRGLSVRCVPTDLDTGVDIAALDRALGSEPKPRFIVLIPSFHNPLGVTIPPENRREIVSLAEAHRVPIIEDDPYSPLQFEGDSSPPLAAFARQGCVFYIGSFSKMLAPALRLGWIVAPEELASRIVVLREAMDLESSQLLQRTAAEFLQTGMLEVHLSRLNETNRRRRRILMAALDDHFAPIGAQWSNPRGGLFCWVQLPRQYNTWKLFKQAVQQKVAFIPGEAFAVHGGHAHTMRLNFSNASEQTIPQAVSTIAAVLQQHNETYSNSE